MSTIDHQADSLCLRSIHISSAINFVDHYGDKISEAELTTANRNIAASLRKMADDCNQLATSFD